MPSTDARPLQKLFQTGKHFLLSGMHRGIKTSWGGRLLNLILARASWLIPFPRSWESSSWLAFAHPRPVQPLHLLLPKRPYRDLIAVPPEDPEFLAEMVVGLQTLIAEHKENLTSYRVIINSGEAQEINHLHIHLLGGDYG